MYKQKSMVVLAGLVLVAVSILSAPAAVAEESEYVGLFMADGNNCANFGTMLPCFDVDGNEVTVVIDDDSGLEVNGILKFRDSNGDLIEQHAFCGQITQAVPSGAKDIMIDRYLSPPPVVNGCTEVFWTTGTISATWN